MPETNLVQWLTFFLAIALTIFTAGRYFGADKAMQEWRSRVNKLLEPLEGLTEWKKNETERRQEMSGRLEYVHDESKSRDVRIQESLVALAESFRRTYVTNRVCETRHDEKRKKG